MRDQALKQTITAPDAGIDCMDASDPTSTLSMTRDMQSACALMINQRELPLISSLLATNTLGVTYTVDADALFAEIVSLLSEARSTPMSSDRRINTLPPNDIAVIGLSLMLDIDEYLRSVRRHRLAASSLSLLSALLKVMDDSNILICDSLDSLMMVTKGRVNDEFMRNLYFEIINILYSSTKKIAAQVIKLGDLVGRRWVPFRSKGLMDRIEDMSSRIEQVIFKSFDAFRLRSSTYFPVPERMLFELFWNDKMMTMKEVLLEKGIDVTFSSDGWAPLFAFTDRFLLGAMIDNVMSMMSHQGGWRHLAVESRWGMVSDTTGLWRITFYGRDGFDEKCVDSKREALSSIGTRTGQRFMDTSVLEISRLKMYLQLLHGNGFAIVRNAKEAVFDVFVPVRVSPDPDAEFDDVVGVTRSGVVCTAMATPIGAVVAVLKGKNASFASDRLSRLGVFVEYFDLDEIRALVQCNSCVGNDPDVSPPMFDLLFSVVTDCDDVRDLHLLVELGVKVLALVDRELVRQCPDGRGNIMYVPFGVSQEGLTDLLLQYMK